MVGNESGILSKLSQKTEDLSTRMNCISLMMVARFHQSNIEVIMGANYDLIISCVSEKAEVLRST